MATAGPGSQPFRKRLFGYAAADVDRVIAGFEAERRVMQAELERLRSAPEVSPEVSVHLAALLQSFAESVADGQREAEARAVQIVADAERRRRGRSGRRATGRRDRGQPALMQLDQANEMVAATYADATTRYQEASVIRHEATERIGEAVARSGRRARHAERAAPRRSRLRHARGRAAFQARCRRSRPRRHDRGRGRPCARARRGHSAPPTPRRPSWRPPSRPPARCRRRHHPWRRGPPRCGPTR